MSGIAEARPAATAARRSTSLRGRLMTRGLLIFAGLLGLLPEAVLVWLANAVGEMLYLIQGRRRRLVRANLRRVCGYLASNGMAGESAMAAAVDSRALDRLTRAAFGHWVRGYVEAATLQRRASAEALALVRPDDEAAAAEAFPMGRRGPTIVVGLHFGAVEIPALWASRRGVPITAPMETVNDPDMQAYFERTREGTGLRMIPLAGAAQRLRETLERGETAALVADRALAGSGARVELFGAPTRLPLGPAVLALETHAPVWLVAARRAPNGVYRARLERLELPAEGSPRQRLSGFLAAEARAMERAVADAPEQWWTAFFPVWDDIPGDRQ